MPSAENSVMFGMFGQGGPSGFGSPGGSPKIESGALAGSPARELGFARLDQALTTLASREGHETSALNGERQGSVGRHSGYAKLDRTLTTLAAEREALAQPNAAREARPGAAQQRDWATFKESSFHQRNPSAVRAENASEAPPEQPAPQEAPVGKTDAANDEAAIRDMHAKLDAFSDKADRLEKAFQKDPELYDKLQSMSREAAAERLDSLTKSPQEKSREAFDRMLNRQRETPDAGNADRPEQAADKSRSLREMREDVGYYRTAQERSNYYKLVRQELRDFTPSKWEVMQRRTEKEAEAHGARMRERHMERDGLSAAERAGESIKDLARDQPTLKEAAIEWEAYLQTEAGRRLEYMVTGRTRRPDEER